MSARLPPARSRALALACALALLAGVAAVPPAAPRPDGVERRAAREQLPPPFRAYSRPGIDPAVREVRGRVRVHIQLRRVRVLRDVLRAARRVQAAQTLPLALARRAGADVVLGRRLALRSERARVRSLRLLARLLRPSAHLLGRATERVLALGGRVEESDPITLSLTAELPTRAAIRLGRSPLVWSLSLAPRRDPLVRVGSDAVGAPIWWANGALGQQLPGYPPDSMGTGPDLFIGGDTVDGEHPAYRPLLERGRLLVPPGYRPVCTATDEFGDPCSHGTAIAAMAIGQGCDQRYDSRCAQPGNGAELGIAPGIDKLIVDGEPRLGEPTPLPCGGEGYPFFSGYWWGIGLPVSFVSSSGCSGTWPIAPDPAETVSASHGGIVRVTDPDDVQGDRRADAVTSSVGILFFRSAGNTGYLYDSGTRAKCDGQNEVCVGAFHPGASVSDRSDDEITYFSERGPTPGGRKKPDMVAVGAGFGRYPNPFWRNSGEPLFTSRWTGTSFSAPQAAGAAVLLHSVGVVDPLARKALLLNSAYKPPTLGCPQDSGSGRDSQGYSPQWGWWDPCWGWGALDLARAWRERANWASGVVRPGAPVFYRTRVESPDDRATVAWNRRGTIRWVSPYEHEVLAATLTDIDLVQAAPDGRAQEISGSRIDNVEQVRARRGTFPRQVVYKVVARSQIDGLAAEPFAIAATRPLEPVAAPVPTVNVERARSGDLRVGESDTLRISVRNPAGELAAHDVALAVELPPSLRAIDPASFTLGILAPGESARVEVRVTAVAAARGTVRVTARAAALGEELSDGRELAVTTVPPPTGGASGGGSSGQPGGSPPASGGGNPPAGGTPGGNAGQVPSRPPAPRPRLRDALVGAPLVRLRGRSVELVFRAHTRRGWRAQLELHARRGKRYRRVRAWRLQLRCRGLGSGRWRCRARRSLTSGQVRGRRTVVVLSRRPDSVYRYVRRTLVVRRR